MEALCKVKQIRERQIPYDPLVFGILNKKKKIRATRYRTEWWLPEVGAKGAKMGEGVKHTHFQL